MTEPEWVEWRAQLLPIFERAARGNLRLAELPRVATGREKRHETLGLLLGDLEDAVEHFPGRLRDGKADWGAWEIADERTVLLVDLEAMREATSLDELGRLRSAGFKAKGIRRR